MSINATKARRNLGSAASVRNTIQVHQLASSGDIALEEASIDPASPAPGASMELQITLRETAEFVGPFDAALCDPPGLNQTGLLARVTVSPDWTGDISREYCVGVFNLAQNTRQETISMTAPDSEGQHTVTVEVQQPGLGPDTFSFSFDIVTGGRDEPTNGGQDGGGDGGDGGDGGGLTGLLNDLPTILGLLLVLVAITTVS